jgi:hypothetical protein
MDIANMLVEFLKNYPVFGSIVFCMGALRVIFKPLMVVLREYVLYTPNGADDAVLNAVEASAPYKFFAALLDFFASIKLPGA